MERVKWDKSENAYDWLGEGIYFWEHSPTRALRWATEGFRKRAAVVGAVIQLGTCFDLLDERITALLADTYPELAQSYEVAGKALPANRGRGGKLRELDCAVINDCVRRMGLRHVPSIRYVELFSKGRPYSREQLSLQRPTFRLQFAIWIAFWGYFAQTLRRGDR